MNIEECREGRDEVDTEKIDMGEEPGGFAIGRLGVAAFVPGSSISLFSLGIEFEG